jgi:hypothetical protein
MISTVARHSAACRSAPLARSPARRAHPGRRRIDRDASVGRGDDDGDRRGSGGVEAAAVPLLLHQETSTFAAIRAAEELSEATRHDDPLFPRRRLRQALSAHVAWIDANALGYRAILQGGISADAAERAIVEDARAQGAADRDVRDRRRRAYRDRRQSPRPIRP